MFWRAWLFTVVPPNWLNSCGLFFDIMKVLELIYKFIIMISLQLLLKHLYQLLESVQIWWHTQLRQSLTTLRNHESTDHMCILMPLYNIFFCYNWNMEFFIFVLLSQIELHYVYTYMQHCTGADTGYLERGVNSINYARAQNFDHTHKLLDHAPN